MAKSGIHIKAANRGKFTAKAKASGMTVQQKASAALKPGSKASAATKKQANFARNAARWNKG